MNGSGKGQTAAYAVAAVLLVVGGAYLLRTESGAKPAGGGGVALDGAGAGSAGSKPSSAAGPAAGGPVYVHVAGAVRRPGIYRVPAGSRVAVAVRKAGGLTRRADLTAFNLAAAVRDAQQVIVPRRGQAGAAGATATAVRTRRHGRRSRGRHRRRRARTADLAGDRHPRAARFARRDRPEAFRGDHRLPQPAQGVQVDRGASRGRRYRREAVRGVAEGGAPLVAAASGARSFGPSAGAGPTLEPPRVRTPVLGARSLPALSAYLRDRPYHVGLAALCGGLALAPAGRPAAAVAATAALIAFAALRAPSTGLLAAALVIAGAGIGVARIEAEDRSTLVARAPEPFEGTVLLVEPPRPSPFGSRATLEVAGGADEGERVMAYADRDLRWPSGAGAGLEFEAAGSLRRPGSKPAADFDWPAYLRRRGIAVELNLYRLRPTGRRRGGLLGAIDAARRRAERGIAAGLSRPHAALARGMVLGQDEQVSEALREDFRRSGLAHIMAVSGQNVMLLCALVLPFLMVSGAGPRARAAVMLALIAVYVPLAGAGPSLQRAGVIGCRRASGDRRR